jgi:4-hydroxybenzoate polyprenyltransferase
MDFMTVGTPRFSKLASFFWLLRPNRSFMVVAVTGSGAFAARAGLVQALWMTLVGWCLAVGGLTLDFYADRSLDVEAPRTTIRQNS